MKNAYLLLPSLLFLASCANYRRHLDGEAIQPSADTLGQPAYTLYLIGDTGSEDSTAQLPPALQVLGEKLATAPKESAVIFLGNTVLPKGLPGRNTPERAAAEAQLNRQLELLKNFKGQPYFVPGNRDWAQKKHRKGVERMEDYVEETLDRGDVWLPDDGCSGPVAEDLAENLTVLFVDSEWYRMNWLREKELNEGCDIKSRESFAFFLQDEMKKNRRKNIVVAMHHPIYSNGNSGGKYDAKQHLFPFDKFMIPLPVIGSGIRFLQGASGTRQDVSHPQARELRKVMESSALKNGNFIFASAHDAGLQYFEVQGQDFIVSGAGEGRGPVGQGRGMQFGQGGVQGFSVLKFYPKGEVFLEMWAADGEKKEGNLLFARQIKPRLQTFENDIPTEFPEYRSGQDSFTLALNPYVKNGAVHRYFWGNHYRKTYRQPVTAPVLDLETWNGGLTPLKRGGGSQTNSLRVRDAKGREWVLRDMLKDETRIVPYPYSETFAKDVFADQFTGSHPYAAFTIGRMAEALGLYHTNPRLYYIAKQPRLGEFNDSFGGGLYLVEERADDDRRDVASFGNSKNLISTPDVLEKKEKNANHRIDGPFTVRSRLFDNLLGDFDRHDDNWRWASFEDKKTGITTYRPIARDRDQPYIKYDGLIPRIISHGIPFLKQLKVYGKEVDNIKWVNYHSKYFDPTFLTQNDWKVWEEQARFIQENLTDAVIDSALRDFPAEIYALDGPWIAERLKGRRGNMLEIARDFYLLVSRKVDIIGTNDQDYFEVERLDNERTRVRVYASNKEGEKKEVYYDRTFLTNETKEVRLYGLDQEDRFFLTGTVGRGILVRCIGGLDDDYFTDESRVGGLRKKTLIYDTKKDNHLQGSSETANRTSNDPVLNTYDRRSWDTEHNYGMSFPLIAFNPDDGVVLGGGFTHTRFGFKKSPYAARHFVLGKYALETNGWSIDYKGEFIHAVQHWDVLAGLKLQGPLFTRNFFGLGNDTPFYLDQDDEEDIENFVRVRQQLYGAYPALRRRFGENFSLSVGALAESVQIENTTDRLVNSTNPEIRPAVFEPQQFGGGELQLNFLNADNLANPTQGFTANATAGWKKNLSESGRQFGWLAGHFGVTLGGNRVVVSSLAGVRHVLGDAEFYQLATLGARTNLRGFRNERFTGQTAVYHQNDLRLRLFNVKNYILPFTLGVLGGFDYGRVWLGGRSPGGWHQSYGGGLWLSPFDLMVLTVSYFQSEDGGRVEVRGGFAF